MIPDEDPAPVESLAGHPRDQKGTQVSLKHALNAWLTKNDPAYCATGMRGIVAAGFKAGKAGKRRRK